MRFNIYTFLFVLIITLGGDFLYAQKGIDQAWYPLRKDIQTNKDTSYKCTPSNSYGIEDTVGIIDKKEGVYMACVMKKHKMDVLASPAIKGNITSKKNCATRWGTGCNITIYLNEEVLYSTSNNGSYGGSYLSWFRNRSGKGSDSQNQKHRFCRGLYPVYLKPNDITSSVNLCDYLNKERIAEFINNRQPLTSLDDIFIKNRIRDFWIPGQAVYRHDITLPECSEGNIFYGSLDDLPINTSNTNEYRGEWTYKPLFKRGKCSDKWSGCTESSKETLENATFNGNNFFTINLKDNAGNLGAARCHAKPILLDVDIPILESNISVEGDIKTPDNNTTFDVQSGQPLDENTGESADKNKPRFIERDLGESNLYADPLTINFSAIDPKNNNGVSKIKSSKLEIFNCGESNLLETQEKTFTKIPFSAADFQFQDTKKLSFVAQTTKKEGCYDMKLRINDWAGNYSIYKFKIHIVPNLNISAVLAHDSKDSVYANHLDTHNFAVEIKDIYKNSIHDKKFVNLQYKGEDIKLSNQDKTALTLEYNEDTPSNEGGKVDFSYKSYMPGKLEHKFSVQYQEWDKKYTSFGERKTISIQNDKFSDFKKLYTSQIDFASGGTIKSDPVIAKLTIGSNNEILVNENKQEKARLDEIIKETIKVNNTKITPPEDGKDVTKYPYTFLNPAKCQFKNADYKSICFYAQALLGITAKNELNIWARPMISYKFKNGPFVKYQLSPTPTGYTNEPVTLSGGTLNGIYIGGQQRSNGKDGIVSNMENIGGLKGFEFTNAIRKQVALVTRNRKANDGKVIGKVLYVSGDKNLNDLLSKDWETVIVENGNLTIDANLENRDNPKGIIVTSNSKNTGNIYIKPNVTKLSAFIYADGSVESVDINGDVFKKSDISRTKSLTKQLMIYGGLLSKNTIGGAILGKLGEKYILPGGKSTDNLDEAVRFDLSFLRMYNYGKDGSTKWSKDNDDKKWHQGHKESTVIIPNPKLISNPPAVFNFKE